MTRPNPNEYQEHTPNRGRSGPTDGNDPTNPSAAYTPDYMPAEVAPADDPGATLPPTTTAPAPSEVPARDDPIAQTKHEARESERVRGSFAGGAWAALILGAVLLILLLVFILQNQQQVEVNLFAWSWQFPSGVAYLFAAIVGALIMALVGGWRMFELRRQLRRANKRAAGTTS